MMDVMATMELTATSGYQDLAVLKVHSAREVRLAGRGQWDFEAHLDWRERREREERMELFWIEINKSLVRKELRVLLGFMEQMDRREKWVSQEYLESLEGQD